MQNIVDVKLLLSAEFALVFVVQQVSCYLYFRPDVSVHTTRYVFDYEHYLLTNLANGMIQCDIVRYIYRR